MRRIVSSVVRRSIVSSSIRVVKRDGKVVNFNKDKIKGAVWKAFNASKERDASENVTNAVISDLEKDDKASVGIEDIQELVENELMKLGHLRTAKAYIKYREKRSALRQFVPDNHLTDLEFENTKHFDGDLVRTLVYKRTYARWIPEKNRREVWSETVDRYMAFMYERIGTKFDGALYDEIRQAILKQEVMPSMRLLQFAGPAARKCNVCVYNCAYVAPQTFKDLADIIYILMSGTGIGFSVEKTNVDMFPVIEKQTGQRLSRYAIQDSREGWADAFQHGLETWYAGKDVSFNYSLLRPAGARLVTMGGRSSGPDPLRELMIFTRELILGNQGKKLSPINIHDIICKIGQIVVSGGTRRSSLISLSDLSDHEMRHAKDGSFWTTAMHRSLANNSAVYAEKPKMTDFMEEWTALVKSGTGERGIFNRGSLKAMMPERRVKSLGESIMEIGVNPCSEILLKSREFCNLTEVVCRSDDTEVSLRRKLRIASILGTYQSTLTNFGYISPQWAINQADERLLGVSLTGQWDCPVLRHKHILSTLREDAIATNLTYSKVLGVNPSASITAIKPSGTVSQMVGSSSGMHARYAPYYIRRIRISATDPLFKLMRDQGFVVHPEVGQDMDTANTFVLEFPVKAPEGAVCTKDLTALEQLEYTKMVRSDYTEHNTSVTISVKADEWLKVGQWVWENWDFVTGLSFFPYNDHVYQLAPYEEISKEEYESRLKALPKVNFAKLVYYETTDSTDVKKEVACAGGVCEL